MIRRVRIECVGSFSGKGKGRIGPIPPTVGRPSIRRQTPGPAGPVLLNSYGARMDGPAGARRCRSRRDVDHPGRILTLRHTSAAGRDHQPVGVLRALLRTAMRMSRSWIDVMGSDLDFTETLRRLIM